MIITEVKINLDIDPGKEYRLAELAQILGYTDRYLQMEIKNERLKYLHKVSPRYGGTIITGKQVLEWLLKYKNCGDIIELHSVRKGD